MSAAVPGVKPTIRRIGRDGCQLACRAMSKMAVRKRQWFPSLGGQPAQYVLIQLFSAPGPPADTGDPQRTARGRALADQNHCNICDRSDFTGQQNVPRVADQRNDYLLQTMTGVQDWYTACLRCHHGRRLQPVNDNDLGLFAHFLAHVR